MLKLYKGYEEDMPSYAEAMQTLERQEGNVQMLQQNCAKAMQILFLAKLC